MKSLKQFLSESVNIAGDFNGNLYISGNATASVAAALQWREIY